MGEIITFAILQLVNVFFSTIKTIVQIKGTKIMATIVNAIYYSFYTIVVVFMVADFPIWVKMLITFGTNLIGTWCSMTLMERLRKDKLWKIDITCYTKDAESIHKELKEVPHSFIVVTDKHTVFTFYCAHGADSKKVKEVVRNYDVKYFISESKKAIL